ncbi:MAG: sigma-54 dependent transcriptional regulator, partial [Pseudomonadota bacterium]
ASFGNIDEAVQAWPAGAYHLFLKPVSDLDLFWQTVVAAAAQKKAAEKVSSLSGQDGRVKPVEWLIGASPAWQKVVESVRKVAPLPSSVLITGETGTGKEVIARTIHRLSPRAGRPFVAASCAAFAGSLLETELFGHERGAFTGAVTQRPGIFEQAHGGTLFLDEIAETSPELQGKLLRVLQGAPFTRVGGATPINSDFRLVAATNRDLEDELAQGSFRRDLYYRLAVYPIKLPPLRQRLEDVLPLTMHFLGKTARKLGRQAKTISGPSLVLLVQHPWPGNVRELENLIERAFISSTGREIQPQDLFPETPPEMGQAPGLILEEVERLMIGLALQRTGHNKTRAAQMLGIARKTLQDKLIRFNLKTPFPLPGKQGRTEPVSGD